MSRRTISCPLGMATISRSYRAVQRQRQIAFPRARSRALVAPSSSSNTTKRGIARRRRPSNRFRPTWADLKLKFVRNNDVRPGCPPAFRSEHERAGREDRSRAETASLYSGTVSSKASEAERWQKRMTTCVGGGPGGWLPREAGGRSRYLGGLVEKLACDPASDSEWNRVERCQPRFRAKSTKWSRFASTHSTHSVKGVL